VSPETATFTTMSRALLREIPDTFERAIVRDATRRPDVALARRQHARYREFLEAAGYEVEMLPGDEAHPDCVFIEDTAVIVGPRAVITRPGAESRRDEVGPVAETLGRTHDIDAIVAPGTLDGGDVMLLDGTLYAGRSLRSNDAGLTQLRDATEGLVKRMVVVPVRDVLHLKSAVQPVASDTVVVTPGTVDESLLAGLRIVHEVERGQFTALSLETGQVLVSESAPKTADAVASLGIDITTIDVSEILAADGGLTCMSILI